MGKKKNLLDTIRGENRTSASYKANPYMTPSLAPRKWSAWMSNIFIALIVVVAGIVLLVVSADMGDGGRDFYIGGWACIGVGGAFLLLGFCWYKNIVSHEEAERLVEDGGDDDRVASPASLNTSTTRLSDETESVHQVSPPPPPHVGPPALVQSHHPAHAHANAHGLASQTQPPTHAQPEGGRKASGHMVRFKQPPVYQYN